MAMSMPPSPQLLALGLALALLVAGGGYLAGALSRSGALGALGVGTAVFGLGGPLWGLLLLAFFASSSALSEWRAADKQDPAGRFQKGGRRDLGQVLANGGVAAVLAALQAASNLGWIGPLDLFPALVGALAAVTADTWATEADCSSTALAMVVEMSLIWAITSPIFWIDSIAPSVSV